ncbi:MAG TPA: hypothetical protein VGP08_05860 [Pyrinomonadaceae bacterium]|jgi:hypothetical protein|nr:hypothetical protein [Pyrinomonadaceae bacterium]
MSEQDSAEVRDPRLDRLYELLPVFYRMRDVERGEPLRALLQVIAEQVNVVEDDIAQLYDNWFIETCQDWVVPYVADLIGYRPVSEAGVAGDVSTAEGALRNKFLVPRREVAATLRYRRRKGTLALLELLARDVAGWNARAVEFYQLLSGSQHLNHQRLARARVLDLRDGDALERLEGGFDSASHTVNTRRLNSHRRTGRHAITNAGIFVWRLKAYTVTHAPAFCIDRVRHHYTFSILGNDSPLFNKAVEEPDATHVADEMNVPAPIRRRALDERTHDYYGPSKSLFIWRDDEDRPVPVEHIVTADLSRWAYRPQGDQVAVDPRLGRIAFSTRSEPRTGVWVSYHYGFPADSGGGEYTRRLRMPRKPTLRMPDDDKPSAHPRAGTHVYFVSQRRRAERHFTTINRALEAWRRDAPDDALIQIDDSGAYVEPVEIRLRRNQRLEIRAADGARPVIRLLDWYTNRPDSLVIGPEPEEEDKGEDGEQSHDDDAGESYDAVMPVRVGGRAYVEGVNDQMPSQEAPAGESDQSPRDEDTKPVKQDAAAQDATGVGATGAGDEDEECPHGRGRRVRLDGLMVVGRGLMVEGDIYELSLRDCTLVPGWSLDTDGYPESETEPSIELTDTGARLRVERSIVGSILVDVSEVREDPIEIFITDSVLDATKPDLEALYGPDGTHAHATLRVVRSTVFGLVRAHAISLAENSIFSSRVRVARTQAGCVRFCYVPVGSRTPRRHNCQPDLALSGLRGNDAQTQAERERTEMRVRPVFNSVRYGTPAYCQLAETCPREISRGADDESEMGVYHDLFQPQREANLRARLDEFTPAGVDAGIIFAT